MKDLKGKRLLVLGGSIWKYAIKRIAEQDGIIIISASLYPSGIDEIAKEVYRVDTTKPELMIPFIKEHNIDGVYIGDSELVVSAACQYINELGMPCYCTKEQWELLDDKRFFKELCMRLGLPVTTRENDRSSVCKTTYSQTGSVICENIPKNDSVVVFYFFSNGHPTFSGLRVNIPVKFRKQGTYVGGLFVFANNLNDEFRRRYETQLIQLFNNIGIREGIAWIEASREGDEYYFNECGVGHIEPESIYPVDYLYGYNLLAAEINYALTADNKIEGHPSLICKDIPKKCYYAIYPVYLWPGKIAEIHGVEKISQRSEVVVCSLTKNLGSIIPDSGSFEQNFALIHFVYDTVEECGDMLRFVHRNLKVIDEKGKDLVFKMLDFDSIEIQSFGGEGSFPHIVNASNEENLTVWFRRRMMDVPIYGRTTFRSQYEEALQTFLTKEQLADDNYKEKIGDDVITSYVKYRTRPRDYFYFDFPNLDDNKRESFLTETLEDQTLIEITGFDKYLNDLTDKWHFYELANAYFHREVILFDAQTSKENFIAFCLRTKDLFIKPLTGSEGDGAFTTFIKSTCEAGELYNKLLNTNVKWMVEERIKQSKEMSAWNSSSVNTVRLPTFFNKKGFFVLAPIFRTGRFGKSIDNTSAGGVFSLIDAETGKICSDGHDIYNHIYEIHPDSKIRFRGFQIPRWEELISTAKSLHQCFHGHIYIAWDFALTDKGWDLIEGNWGRFRGAQLAGKTGIKKQFLEYMSGGLLL